MKKILSFLILILVNISIFIFVSKSSDFVFLKFQKNKIPILKRYLEHDTLNHVFAKNFSTTIKAHDSIPKFLFESNSLGLKSKNQKEYTSNKFNKFRILILGDSFVEGYAYNKSLPAILEKILINNNYSDDSIEVINAGVGSYSPILHFFNYKYYLNKLKPDLVILAVDVTDLRDDYSKYSKLLWYDENNSPIGVFPSSGGSQKKLNKTINIMLENEPIFFKILEFSFFFKK